MTPRRTALYFLLGTAAFLALDLLLGAPIRVAAGGEPTPPVTGWEILNLILVGGVLVASFHGGLRRAAGSAQRGAPGGRGAPR